jgi:hypothetical protein
MNKINIKKYKQLIGTGNQIHKVSYFFKKTEDIKDKKFLIVDFEFSSSYNIYELSILFVKNNKITDIWFEEFKLPSNDKIFDFNLKRPVKIKPSFNKDRNVFTNEKQQKLLNLIDEYDFFVAHNYVAEAQCLFKLLFPNQKYNVDKLNFYKEDKFICTNKSFNNKYFKEFEIFSQGFSNENVSKSLGWEVSYKDKSFIVKNHSNNIDFIINKLPSSFFTSKANVGIHNSLYDTIITYTTFLSLLSFKD